MSVSPRNPEAGQGDRAPHPRTRGVAVRRRVPVGVPGAGDGVRRGARLRAGDDFRSIDWNVSARLASPYVKTFTEERELTLMLLVDQSGSTRFGEPLTKAGTRGRGGVRCWRWPRRFTTIGSARCSSPTQVERVIPPRKGRRHALRVIRDLVAFQPAGRRTNLACQSLLRQPAASPSQHRRGALRFHRRRVGASAAAGSALATKSWPSRWTIRESTSCPTPAGSRCSMPNRAAACWWTPGAATSAAGLPASRRAAEGAEPDPDLGGRRRGARWRPARDYALPLRRAFARRARRIHRG